MTTITWICLPTVREKLKCGTTRVYDLIQNEGFPRPVKNGRRSVWVEEEVEVWMREQAAKRAPVENEATWRHAVKKKRRSPTSIIAFKENQHERTD